MGAAGVGDVGDVESAIGAAGKVPGEKGIDRTENYFTGFGLLPDARHMLQQPADLQAAEIGAERKSGLAAKTIRPALAGKFGDVVIDARVLPDQRVGHGLAGFPVPEDGSLTLVGDADRGQIGSAKVAAFQSLRNDVLGGPPDFLGIVLHPSRLRINLLVLFLRGSHNPAGSIKHAETRAGRPLINGTYVFGHGGLW